jgi:CcdB protein
MARLDVRRLKTKGRVSLVVEIQSDYMRDIPTVLVAPLVKTTQLPPYGQINPIVNIDGEELAIRLEQMAGISSDNMGSVVTSILHMEDEISVALNRLIFYV